MELAKLDNQLPIKAYPEAELNRIILTQFTVWVSNLLSLTDETSMNRLEVALPSIKEHCWSMGFAEIKKMLEMYADSKLSIKPVPNYFDRILFGKIVEAYKEQKVVPKKVIKETISETEKRSLVVSGMKKCLDEYERSSTILDGYILFMYDIFLDDKLISPTKEDKIKFYQDAKTFLEMESKREAVSLNDRQDLKHIAKEIQKKNSAMVVMKAKEMIVMRFLRETYRDSALIEKLKLQYA